MEKDRACRNFAQEYTVVLPVKTSTGLMVTRVSKTAFCDFSGYHQQLEIINSLGKAALCICTIN